ncbi:WhiB family transcriptional regulator [Kitasatospora sp. NPDC007106]|uniref:WhiB family transcriptional regulator n=1 Tax=Kitasatospora sp. NPDC007106 TaxID=3156914 RepID=UPI0034063C04
MARRTTQTAAQPQPACRGYSWSLFYGSDDESKDRAAAREATAKRLCARCPMRQACLDEELARKPFDQHGVRGAMTADERRAEIARRAVANQT